MSEVAVPVERFERLPLDRIRIRPGHNPRAYFDPVALEELADSIRAQGVTQNIVVRPHPELEGYYELLAGERRWRASFMAGKADIPALIREVDDAEALRIAVHENSKRDDMTPADEATTARRAVDLCEGDQGEASRLLGWPISRLQQRLLLLHACKETLDAVNEKRIKLGHAELLSTLPETRQRQVLAKVVETGATVDQLKAQLAAFTQDLAAARFDTTGCNGCPHNSSTQASLFEQHVGEGRCANAPCWQGKTSAHVEAMRQEAQAEFNVVWLDRDKDPVSYRRVEAGGKQGVGEEQLQAGCKGCASFGAVVCTRPGKEGQVAGGVCFNLSCHGEKVAAQREVLEAQAPHDSGKPAKDKTPKAGGKAKGKKVSKVSVGAGSPRKVTECVHAFLREVAADAVVPHPQTRTAMVTLALRNLTAKVHNPEKELAKLLAMDVDALQAEQDQVIAALIRNKTDHAHRLGKSGKDADVWIKTSAVVVGSTAVPLAGRFKLDKAFLDAHTKSGLEALLQQAEYWRSCEGETDQDRKKAVSRLMGQKRDEIVRVVLASQHDFSQFVPLSVLNELTALRKASGEAA